MCTYLPYGAEKISTSLCSFRLKPTCNAFQGIIVQLCLNLDYAFHRQAINVFDLINVVLISDFS